MKEAILTEGPTPRTSRYCEECGGLTGSGELDLCHACSEKYKGNGFAHVDDTPTPLGQAIALVPSDHEHYAKERDRLYRKLGIKLTPDGQPIIKRDYKKPGVADLPKDLIAPPPGHRCAKTLAKAYRIPYETFRGYLRKWMALNPPLPVAGYFRANANGACKSYVLEYFDPVQFREFLLDCKHNSAKRLLANVGIGRYTETRGGHMHKRYKGDAR